MGQHICYTRAVARIPFFFFFQNAGNLLKSLTIVENHHFHYLYRANHPPPPFTRISAGEDALARAPRARTLAMGLPDAQNKPTQSESQKHINNHAQEK